jgi:two-component system response regulator ResD
LPQQRALVVHANCVYALAILFYNKTMAYKVAIIEDEPVISQMYRMKFEAEGFEVEVAENGEIGVEMVKNIRPDVILLDIKMPVMGGTEALRQIRAAKWGKDIPVLVLTNVGEQEAPAALSKLNIHSYIVKADYTPSQVTRRVKEALGLAVEDGQ